MRILLSDILMVNTSTADKRAPVRHKRAGSSFGQPRFVKRFDFDDDGVIMIQSEEESVWLADNFFDFYLNRGSQIKSKPSTDFENHINIKAAHSVLFGLRSVTKPNDRTGHNRNSESLTTT